MKFTIENAALTGILAATAKAVPAKPVQAILSNYLLELSNGLLRVTASDAEIALRALVRPDDTDDSGSTCVPAKILLELMKTLPGGPVTFELNTSADNVRVSWKTGESTLPAFPAGDYIQFNMPKKDESATTSVSSDVLLSAINKTIGAVATDEVRPALNGIYFDLAPGESFLAATNAKELLAFGVKTPDLKQKNPFILPTKAASILKSTMPKDVTVTIVSDAKTARFAFGNIELTTRLVIGKYPAWQKVLPVQNPNVMTVNRDDLINALRRMSVMADKSTSIIKVNLSFNQVNLTGEDLGYATRGSETIPCDYDGENICVGLKATSIIDTLLNIEQEEVEIRFRDARSAVYIIPSGEKASEEPLQAVVMPYQISK